jgi:probable selenium-dependent hydroxylase accessory protein YqeC
MLCQHTSLLRELEGFGPGIVCLTGGGGKTTLLFALGAALAKEGQSVLCTTSTRVCRPGPEAPFPVLLEPEPASFVLPPAGALFAARPASGGRDPAKVYGYSAAEIDALRKRFPVSWILVEADGAAGKPLKAPAAYEPVIPGETAVVLGVIGLSCLLPSLCPAPVFRPEHFSALTGLAPGEAVTPEAVAGLVTHPRGLFQHSPDAAKRLLFCNQADLPGALEAGADLAQALFARKAGLPHALYLGSVRADSLRCRKLFPE